MGTWFFVSDLHGQLDRYQKLFRVILLEKPEAVFLGGDLCPAMLPATSVSNHHQFVEGFLVRQFRRLRETLKDAYPRVEIILGNDDLRVVEGLFLEESGRLWDYLNCRAVELGRYRIYGYPYVPPTPFVLKDWERYDVSHFVDLGCISPEEGWRSMAIPAHEAMHSTIQMDLANLTAGQDLSNAIFLFHTPPYQTALDQVAREGKLIEGVRTDTHVGSIAVRRFIESRQPFISLHGHIHQSVRLTGCWSERIGRTFACSAAHDGSELALVRFSPNTLETASRELL